MTWIGIVTMEPSGNKTDILQKAHKTNIQRLLEEFGDARGEEIQKVYSVVRDDCEANARIKDYSPIFVYRNVKDLLKQDQ